MRACEIAFVQVPVNPHNPEDTPAHRHDRAPATADRADLRAWGLWRYGEQEGQRARESAERGGTNHGSDCWA